MTVVDANVEAVRRYLRVFKTRDLAELADLVADDEPGHVAAPTSVASKIKW
jgi:ketosteroid isomerase-like protein